MLTASAFLGLTGDMGDGSVCIPVNIIEETLNLIIKQAGLLLGLDNWKEIAVNSWRQCGSLHFTKGKKCIQYTWVLIQNSKFLDITQVRLQQCQCFCRLLRTKTFVLFVWETGPHYAAPQAWNSLFDQAAVNLCWSPVPCLLGAGITGLYQQAPHKQGSYSDNDTNNNTDADCMYGGYHSFLYWILSMTCFNFSTAQ